MKAKELKELLEEFDDELEVIILQGIYMPLVDVWSGNGSLILSNEELPDDDTEYALSDGAKAFLDAGGTPEELMKGL